MSYLGYFGDWHVAGDPTLIIIRLGILRSVVRDKSYRDLVAGDIFIAQDRLPDNIVFNKNVHGHKA